MRRPRRVLAVGAHPDDVEIGCGATLLAHAEAGDEVALLVLTDGGRGAAPRLRRAEQEAAADLLGARLLWGGFGDGFVPSDARAVDAVEEALAVLGGADVVYTHALHDAHGDHVATARAVVSAARGLTTLLHYQSPSTLAFSPSVFVDVARLVTAKRRLVACHAGQVAASPSVDLDAVDTAGVYWGRQSRLEAAEAFEVTRLAWDPVAGARRADESLPRRRSVPV